MQQHAGRITWLLGIGTAFLAATALAHAAEPSLELVRKIDLKGKAGGLDHLALDAKRQRLFVANKANNTMDIVDLKTNKLYKQIPGQTGIQGIAYAPDLDRIYVGLGGGGLFNIFNASNYRMLKTIKFADDSDNVRYHEPTHLVYVAHAEASLGVVDANKMALKKDIKLPGDAESFQLESHRPLMYVCIPTPSQVAVIDTEKNEIVKTYPVTKATGGHPLALDETNHRIFIGCRKEPMVVVMDTETGQEITTVPIAGDVDDLYLDAKSKRLYASCGEGMIIVIQQQDLNHYEVLEKVATAKRAQTSLLVPDAGFLYLAVPRQEGKKAPEVWIYKVHE